MEICEFGVPEIKFPPLKTKLSTVVSFVSTGLPLRSLSDAPTGLRQCSTNAFGDRPACDQ